MTMRVLNNGAIVIEETTPLLPISVDNEIQPPNAWRRKFWGGCLALGASLTYTIYNFFIKQFRMDFTDVLLVRTLGQILVFGLVARINGHQFWPRRDQYEEEHEFNVKCFLLLFQGFCAGCVMISAFVAVTLIPMGDALCMVYSAPLFTLAFSALFLGHKLRIYKVLIGLCLITGILMVIRPPSVFPAPASKVGAPLRDTTYFFGVMAGLGAAMCGAGLTVAVNYLKEFNKNVIIFYGGIGGLFNVFVMFSFDTNSKIFHDITHAEFGKIFLLAFMGLSAVFMAIQSYQMISPPVASVLRSQEVIFAYIVQSIALGMIPDAITIGGGALVVLSAIFVPLEDHLVARIPCESMRHLF